VLLKVIVNMDNSPAIRAVPAVHGLPKETRVAVLFQRFGPYHHARLNAAGQLMRVWGLEACAMEDTYAWAKVEGAEAFTRITLTDRDSGDRRWKRELQRKLWQALDEIKPHVVVINGWSSTDALSALWWCGKTKTPAVVMSESTAWDEPRVFWKERIKGRLVKMCAAGLAGGTPHADYLAQLGLPRDRIFPGYDIVDNDYFAAGAAKWQKQKAEIGKQKLEERGDMAKIESLPSSISHLPSSPFFLASARFVGKKNLARLVRAYARYRALAGKSEIWKLVLLGDGPMREALNAQLTILDLHDHVLLPGFKQYDELPAFFGLAGAFVHASTTEQWGLVVNEAMASGLPVLVSSRCGCATDLVKEGVNGFAFDPLDPEQLPQLMLKVSASDFPLSEFGSASREIISAWGPERFAEGLCGATSAALNNRRASAGMLDRLLLRLVLNYDFLGQPGF
jgi:1,2-diacylglycerol 3-alpha-glucosyltransferase